MRVWAFSIAFSGCLFALPVPLLAEDDAFQWLERMDSAMSQMSYQGTFVYVHEDDVETMRITHVVDEEGLRERLVSVSGTPREVIRDAQGVRWIAGEERTLLANSAEKSTFFPELPLGDPVQASQSYEFRLADKQRIAGHSARRLDIVPKDQYRYGYSLWIEVQSGLLLQWELTSYQGITLAKLMFTELKIGSQVDIAELQAMPVKGSLRSTGSMTLAERYTISSIPRWLPAIIPPGFRLASHQLQQSDQGFPFEHLVYSDGITAVSIYVESSPQSPELVSGLSKLGTTYVFTLQKDHELITVLGDVPAETVRLIGESLHPSAP